MSRVFVSSTYADLVEHRRAVADVLMHLHQADPDIEYSGSRADEAAPPALSDIRSADLFIGVYAWRYGWIPPGSICSVTEVEFDHALALGRRILCYVAHENFAWPPAYVDSGGAREALERFRRKLSPFVRSRFAAPENLAWQIAADVARELAPTRSEISVGGLLRSAWDALTPELQRGLFEAYLRGRSCARESGIATRHLLAALVSFANSAGLLLHQLDPRLVEELRNDSELPIGDDDAIGLVRMFRHEPSFSLSLLASLGRLLPSRSELNRLTAIDLAADLLVHTREWPCARLREAGVDEAEVLRMMERAHAIASNDEKTAAALREFTDIELSATLMASGVHLDPATVGPHLAAAIVGAATAQGRLEVLAGEVLRRRPQILL